MKTYARERLTTDLLGGLRSLTSTLRKGRKAVPQKGHVLLRLESFAVQPAMISSSYTRQSHVLQSEQLDISTYGGRKEQGTGGFQLCFLGGRGGLCASKCVSSKQTHVGSGFVLYNMQCYITDKELTSMV